MEITPLDVWKRLYDVLNQLDDDLVEHYFQSRVPTRETLLELKETLLEYENESEESFVTADSSPTRQIHVISSDVEDSFVVDDDVIEFEQISDEDVSETSERSIINLSDSDNSEDSDHSDNPSPQPQRKEPTDFAEAKKKVFFAKHRVHLAKEMFEKFNKSIFSGQLPQVELEWSNRLNTTAGRTISTRKLENDEFFYSSKIQLSTKVVDTESKLENTLVHEMCHAAVALLDHFMKVPPHGTEFKRWSKLAMKRYPHLNVTTCHSYEIDYKYKWKCKGCERVVGRHSKTIDPAKRCCKWCQGDLIPQFQVKPPTAFQTYLKENLASAKRAMPGSPHKEVMAHLSKKYRSLGQENSGQGDDSLSLL